MKPARRTVWLVALAAIAVVLGAGALLAIAGDGVHPGSQEGFASAQAQSFAATDIEVTTSSGEFKGVPGLKKLEICAPRDGVSATVSLEISGGPAEVRVVVGRKQKKLHPKGATFDPGAGSPQAFSFTFVRQILRKLPGSYSVQWRALTEESVTLHRGSVRVLHGVRHRVGCA